MTLAVRLKKCRQGDLHPRTGPPVVRSRPSSNRAELAVIARLYRTLSSDLIHSL